MFTVLLPIEFQIPLALTSLSVIVTEPSVGEAACERNASFISTVPMFIPSLSW